MNIAILALWGAGYDLPPEEDDWKEPAPKPGQKPVEKGCCRYCGAKVGRGLYRHEKACKERE